jgi:hypothetical protein
MALEITITQHYWPPSRGVFEPFSTEHLMRKTDG